MSVLVFRPSVAPFVQQDARALLEAGLLQCFHTTLCYEPHRLWQRVAVGLSQTLGYDLDRQLRRRCITELPKERITSRPLSELLRLLAARLDGSKRLGEFVWEWAETRFDRYTANHRLTSDVTTVYGYENSSLATFQRARATGRNVIYCVPAPERSWVERLLEPELDEFPVLRSQRH